MIRTSVSKTLLGTLLATTVALVTGCAGDDAATETPDAASPGAADAAPDEPDAPPAPPDAAPPGTPTPRVVPLSATGSDAFFGVAFAADGSFYGVGHVAETTASTADRSLVVAKFTPAGELDTGFGTGGVVIENVAVGGGAGETARGIAVQSTGKIVIAGSIEHDVTATGVAAADRDIVLVRFDTDGTLDESFGEDGIVVLDLNDGLEIMGADNLPRLVGADAVWNVALAGGDKLVVHGAQRATGLAADGVSPRRDTDWVVVRLTADGELDAGFGTGGKFTLDLEQANASARGALVLPDDSVIGGGYANTPGTGSTQAVLYKLTPAGQLDPSFGTGGVFYQIVLGAVTEAYATALQGTKLVTAGYGRNSSSESLDWVSLRVTGAGDLDSSWGVNGVTRIDVGGYADNARNLLVLPDFRVLLIGGGEATMGQKDAMVGILTPSGQPDSSFAPFGYKLHDLGGSADFFWGAALSPDGKTVVLTGLKGAGSMPTASHNDDAAIFVLPIGE